MKSINIIHLNPEEFKEDLLLGVKEQLEEFSKNFHYNNQEELLTRKETAALLKINLATLWSWTKSGKLNSLGIANRVYYKRSEIETALIKIN